MVTTKSFCVSLARSHVMVDGKPSVKGQGGDRLRLQSDFSTSKDNRLLRKSGNSTIDKANKASEAKGTDQILNAKVPSCLLHLDERW